MVENTGGNRRRLLTVREANEYLIYIRKELTAICESLEAEKGSAYTVDDIVRVYNYHNDLTQVLVYADSVIAGLEIKGVRAQPPITVVPAGRSSCLWVTVLSRSKN